MMICLKCVLLPDRYVRVVEELVKYPSSFSLSPSLIKLTQAFWLLDHKDFQEALNVLLDPLVNTRDLTPWQHRRIMKAFLYQGESGRGLWYAQIRQPPMVDPDDIRFRLTLLLANGFIREAFHFQRTHRIRNNAHDLLNHLFHGLLLILYFCHFLGARLTSFSVQLHILAVTHKLLFLSL